MSSVPEVRPLPSAGAPAPADAHGTGGVPDRHAPGGPVGSSDPFDAPDAAWQRLSPRWVAMERIMVLVHWLPVVVAGVLVTGFAWHWWAAGIVAVVGLGWTLYRWLRVARVFAVWGYAERDTDLYIREGIFVQQLTAVPYGRMQLVEVESGPIERRFGLATVRMVTAAAHTHARIPGLDAERATELRDRLAERGEHLAMGL